MLFLEMQQQWQLLHTRSLTQLQRLCSHPLVRQCIDWPDNELHNFLLACRRNRYLAAQAACCAQRWPVALCQASCQALQYGQMGHCYSRDPSDTSWQPSQRLAAKTCSLKSIVGFDRSGT